MRIFVSFTSSTYIFISKYNPPMRFFRKIVLSPYAAFLLLLLWTTGCKNSSGSSSKGSAASETDTVPVNQTEQTAVPLPGMPVETVLEAALNGNVETVRKALESGFDPNTTDPELHTALMLAAYNGHTEILELLLEQGAEVDYLDGMDRTALMYASTGPFVESVKRLLEAGANPNLVDNEEHFSALMFAAAEGQAEVVKTLLEHGADRSLKDVDGDTAYDFAMSNGHTAVAEMVK